MNKLTIAKTKKLKGFEYVVVPTSEYAQNRFFKRLLPACECFADFHPGTAEILTVDEYVERVEND